MKTRARPSGNVSSPLRWTIESASREFRLAPVTLRKNLRQADIQPAEDGTFDTQKIVAGLFGSLREQRLLKERELTKKYFLENQITEANYLSRSELEKAFSQLCAEMVFIIESSNLDRQAQNDLRTTLASIPVEIAGVAESQTKALRRSKNGKPKRGEREQSRSGFAPVDPET
jgi:hypothetical protein